MWKWRSKAHSLFNHLQVSHNLLCNACLHHILKGQRWTVNDSLYHRSLKLKLKCENILDCELAMLPDSKKCKEVIVWSRDFGMDQYVSQCLPPENLSLDVIWAKYKPQTNEVRARFDPLTNFWQGNCSVDEWYNAVQAQLSLAKYPPETASILHREIFWFI